MRILIVAATSFEIMPLLGHLPAKVTREGTLPGYLYHNHCIDVLITGIGMVATSYLLGKHLWAKTYDLAINAGIAGSFNKNIAPGTVVNITEDGVPEMGAEEGETILSVFDLGLADPDGKPYEGGKLRNNNCPFHNNIIIKKLDKASSITSNTVRGTLPGIERIRRIAPADMESMEGAAFFHACMSADVTCLQLRAVSNMVEEREKSHWQTDLAIKNLNSVLLDFLTSF